jgi:hypothetical protein
VSLIENPTVDPHTASVDEDHCREMLSKYDLTMPRKATYEEMEKFWAVKEGAGLRGVRELFLYDPMTLGQKAWKKEKSERKREEQERVLGSKKRRARNAMRRRMQQQEKGEYPGLSCPRVRRLTLRQTRSKKT